MKNSNLIMQYTGRTWSDPEGKVFHIYLITGGPVEQYKEWRNSNGWKTSIDTVTDFVTVFYPAFVGNRATLYKKADGSFGLSVLELKTIQHKAEALYPTYNKVGEQLKQALENRASYTERKTEEFWFQHPTFDYAKYKRVEQVEELDEVEVEESSDEEGLAEG
jgi:hypothetical protein